MKNHRRPAGVDPEALIESAEPLDTQARQIGRRVAAKLFDRALVSSWNLDGIEETVEAEIRSAGGTPPEGVVDVRLGFSEALTALCAIVSAQGGDRSATEREILAELREKFFLALGIAPSC